MGDQLPAAGPVYEQATTMTFAAIVSGQIGCLFACRSERVSAFRLSIGSNPLLLAGIAVELAIAAGLIYLPGLQEGFGMRPFTGSAWAFLLIPGPSVLLIEEGRKWLMRRRRDADGPGAASRSATPVVLP
ncbi:MAG: hypothetical protein EXR51_02830 [Dehalococcoidia bacterium]|nr:hypothetical protein [Dehalococcoidia bacterium]